jgi:non-ribosomal peptide synthetase component E (peptide arylation enzyme)
MMSLKKSRTRMNLIKRAGEKISAEEVENLIMSYPG